MYAYSAFTQLNSRFRPDEAFDLLLNIACSFTCSTLLSLLGGYAVFICSLTCYLLKAALFAASLACSLVIALINLLASPRAVVLHALISPFSSFPWCILCSFTHFLCSFNNLLSFAGVALRVDTEWNWCVHLIDINHLSHELRSEWARVSESEWVRERASVPVSA